MQALESKSIHRFSPTEYLEKLCQSKSEYIKGGIYHITDESTNLSHIKMSIKNLGIWIYWSILSGMLFLGTPLLIMGGLAGLLLFILYSPIAAWYGLIMGTVQGILLRKKMNDINSISSSASKSVILGFFINLLLHILIYSFKVRNYPDFTFYNPRIDSIIIFAISGAISGFCMATFPVFTFKQKKINAFILSLTGLFTGSFLGEQLSQINELLTRRPPYF